jgi:hypothetical protein
MKKRIIFSLAIGIIVGLIIHEPFPSVSVGVLFSIVSFVIFLPFGKDEVEILEEYKREPEDPEEILP